MNIALWIVQGIVAALFGMAGFMKTLQPIEKLSQRMTWVPRYPPVAVRLIGLAEFLGAVGVIVPWVTGIAPVLTPISAIGLLLTQVAAAIHHLQHKEAKMVPMNIVLGALAAFVAVGRWM